MENSVSFKQLSICAYSLQSSFVPAGTTKSLQTQLHSVCSYIFSYSKAFTAILFPCRELSCVTDKAAWSDYCTWCELMSKNVLFPLSYLSAWSLRCALYFMITSMEMVTKFLSLHLGLCAETSSTTSLPSLIQYKYYTRRHAVIGK